MKYDITIKDLTSGIVSKLSTTSYCISLGVRGCRVRLLIIVFVWTIIHEKRSVAKDGM